MNLGMESRLTFYLFNINILPFFSFFSFVLCCVSSVILFHYDIMLIISVGASYNLFFSYFSLLYLLYSIYIVFDFEVS